MAEDVTNEVGRLLQLATEKGEALQTRLQNGEHVPDEEIERTGREIVEAIESANALMREMLGPIDTALMREEMLKDMSPEEFEQWSEDNAALQQYRADQAHEKEGGNG